MAEHLTDADVADRLGVGERWVAEQAKAGRFPHLKLGRKRRYTEAHVAEIVQICEQRPRPASRRSQGRKTSRANVTQLQRKTPRRLRNPS